MGQQYDNSNSGILTRNERKTKDTHPEYTGSAEIDGVEYWISAWVNTGKPGGKLEGKKYFSIKFNPKDVNDGRSKPGRAQEQFEDLDDLPF